ncbi:MAG: glycosyltransferase [Methyloprofundus sp.]|nr:glycosyltransferase [Methyloprofundus sp.]
MKKNMLFVSPRFLFPTDEGGKIRTSQILAAIHAGGQFNITLASPAPNNIEAFRESINSICTHFISWAEPQKGKFYPITRMRHIFSKTPIPVLTDRSAEGSAVVAAALSQKPDLVVFDFPHAAIFAPKAIDVPCIIFTHNVEAEIFQRHVEVASNPISKAIWNNQYHKMMRFEKDTLLNFDTIISVSQKDAAHFKSLQFDNVLTIPTGTDLNFYAYKPPASKLSLVFTGAMDWSANIDAINYMIDSIWPKLIKHQADAKLVVVGRSPPAHLVKKVQKLAYNIEFTGFVDDIRPYVWDASVYIIPMRVGSGTRIKTFEAMALGCPIVSTSLGIEGLAITPDQHYLKADTELDFTNSIVQLLNDQELRHKISQNARQLVAEKFSSQIVAEAFEKICLETIAMKN